MLQDKSTSVVGKYFKSPRIPTGNILVVLIAAYFDCFALDVCRNNSIILLGPKGGNAVVPGAWPQSFHLCNYPM